MFIPYNYIGEVTGLLLAGLLLFAIFYTQPRRTYVFKFLVGGAILSVLSILLQISIIIVANDPESYYNRNLFNLQIFLFLFIYNLILYSIFSYVNMMSIVRRSQRKEFVVMYIVLSIIYYIGIAIEVASGSFYVMRVDAIEIGHFTRYYTSAGLVCAILCFITTCINRKDISRVIWHSVCVLVPLISFVLIMQLIFVSVRHSIFSAMSYVPVFMLGFMLFHNVPYDEATGSRSIHSLDTYTTKNIGRKKFYAVNVYLKIPYVETMIDDESGIFYQGIDVCRRIDAISPKIKMYKLAEDRYVDIIETENENVAYNIIDQIRSVFDGAKARISTTFNYTMICGEVKPELESSIKAGQFFDYLDHRVKDQNNSVCYIATAKDYDSFAEYYEINSVIKDIRRKEDINDERVIVYAQPIYSVKTGTFRTAEALMRLKVGDRIISPDKFIPIAERSGAIHFLTCVILEKVCQEIMRIDDYYDFDAISINVSSKELSQEFMHKDLMEIINRYDFDPSKIRLEITESAMFEDYEMAKYNMKVLTKAGIQFYLDDFGTGYSSLERVINCPFKTIKFDKALLYKSLDDDKMNDIVTYMIEVFKKHGFVTLVEGVEDESQNQYSVSHGFDFIQGYHYAKPEPLAEVKKYFTRKTTF